MGLISDDDAYTVDSLQELRAMDNDQTKSHKD